MSGCLDWILCLGLEIFCEQVRFLSFLYFGFEFSTLVSILRFLYFAVLYLGLEILCVKKCLFIILYFEFSTPISILIYAKNRLSALPMH